MNIRDRIKKIRHPSDYYVMPNVTPDFYTDNVKYIEPMTELVSMYELRVMLRVPFHCTRAELEQATQSAERCMMGNLYGEFLDNLNELARLTWAGDRKASIKVIEEMRKEIVA